MPRDARPTTVGSIAMALNVPRDARAPTVGRIANMIMGFMGFVLKSAMPTTVGRTARVTAVLDIAMAPTVGRIVRENGAPSHATARFVEGTALVHFVPITVKAITVGRTVRVAVLAIDAHKIVRATIVGRTVRANIALGTATATIVDRIASVRNVLLVAKELRAAMVPNPPTCLAQTTL